MLGLALIVALGKTDIAIVLASVCIFGIGYANLFGIVFSKAMAHVPEKANEVSSLLVVGLVGGAILPPILGWISDTTGSQLAAVGVVGIVWIYMIWLAIRIKKASKA